MNESTISESNTILYKNNFHGIEDLKPANNDNTLSWGTWGLLTHLWQQDNFCKINKKSLIQVHRASHYKIGTMLQELRKKWYLFYFPFFKNGRIKNWVWSLHTYPYILNDTSEIEKYHTNLTNIIISFYKQKGE